MDAVSCAGVAPQGQSALLSHSFAADAAIARALHFSLSDHAPPVPTTLMHGGAVPGTDHSPCATTMGAAPSSSARCRQLGPAAAAGGHAGTKRRRPRPSKRAPTTYIRTDAATFRAMVQRVTGADEAELLQQQLHQQQDGLGLGFGGLLLPQHLTLEQFLEATAGPRAPHGVAAAAAPYAATARAVVAAEQQQQQEPLFPTLDSWSVMYGKKNEVV